MVISILQDVFQFCIIQHGVRHFAGYIIIALQVVVSFRKNPVFIRKSVYSRMLVDPWKRHEV